MERILRQGALRAYATAQIPRARSIFYLNQHQYIHHRSSAPTIISSSFWKTLIPKPLRSRGNAADQGSSEGRLMKMMKSSEWNPATFFICIFILIGSMSIQMISIKKDHATFMRRAEVRIGLLREVVEKLQRGEDVDVEKTLGTGDAENEAKWEEAIRDLERSDAVKNAKKTVQKKTPTPTPEVTASKPDPVPVPVPAQSTEAAKPKTSYSNFF